MDHKKEFFNLFYTIEMIRVSFMIIIKLKNFISISKESRNTQKFTEEFLRNRSEIINIYESKLDFDKQYKTSFTIESIIVMKI